MQRMEAETWPKASFCKANICSPQMDLQMFLLCRTCCSLRMAMQMRWVMAACWRLAAQVQQQKRQWLSWHHDGMDRFSIFFVTGWAQGTAFSVSKEEWFQKMLSQGLRPNTVVMCSSLAAHIAFAGCSQGCQAHWESKVCWMPMQRHVTRRVQNAGFEIVLRSPSELW